MTNTTKAMTETTTKHEGGGRKGLSVEDYREAARKDKSSVRSVARELGVTYSTAYAMLKRHSIPVASLGKPPQGDC